jgi:hypothetical protein
VEKKCGLGMAMNHFRTSVTTNVWNKAAKKTANGPLDFLKQSLHPEPFVDSMKNSLKIICERKYHLFMS